MPHKLLLADDSVTIQRVIELTFADEDIQVIAVGDGRQAIERIQSDRPDIVLADIGMPERDGYEVAAFVKGHPDLAHVPVLLLTGAFEPIDEGRARAAGCDGVLVKPFEPQMVINRVKDLLAGKHPAGLWAAATISQPGQTAKPAPPPVPPAPDFDLRTAAPPPPGQAAGGSLEDYFDRLDAAFAELDSSGAAPAAQAGSSPLPIPPPVRAPADVRAPGPGDALAGWDPDLTGDPTRPAPASEPVSDFVPPPAAAPPQRAPVPQQAPAPQPAVVPQPVDVSKPAAVPQPVAVAQPADVPHPALPPKPQPAAQAPASTAAAAVEPPPAPAAPPATPLPAPPPTAPLLSLPEAFAALLSAEQGQPIAPATVRPADIPDATIEEIVRRVVDRMGTTAVQQTVLDVAERMVREEIARIKRGS